MKFNKVTFIAVTGIIVGIGFIAYLKPNGSLVRLNWSADTAAKDTQLSSSEQNMSSHVSNNSPTAIVEQGQEVSDTSDADFQFIFTPSAPVLWSLEVPQRQIEIKRRNNINASIIDIERDLLDNLTLGEQLNLYIPQSKRRLTITLKSIKLGRYSESRIASVDGANGAYSAYFTLGKSSLYGSIETPEGVFHVEKRYTDEAVIYAASEIRKGLDYSVSDAIGVSLPENILH
jgi:hypothetical protein